MTDISKIDYQPLRTIGHIKLGRFEIKYWPVAITLFNFAIVCLVIQASQTKFSYLILISVAAASFVIFLALTTVRLFQRDHGWENFALVNGWSVLPKEQGLTLIPSRLMDSGSSRKSSKVITGHAGPLDFSLHKYQFTVNTGKSSTTFYYTILGINTDLKLPYFSLLSHGKIDIPFDGLIKGVRRLKLEGDFDKHFDLFISNDTEVDVLSVITPDIMQALEQDAQGFDIESESGKLYFYQPGDNRSSKYLPYYFQTAEYMCDQFSQNYKLSHAPPQPHPIDTGR